MSLSRIMTKKVITVDMDENLHRVYEIFKANSFHHLLVVDGDRLVGVLSDRDLLRVMSPFIGTPEEQARDMATLNQKVFKIMTRNPMVLKEHDSLFKVISLFNRKDISCIPVVDDASKPVGIISWRDFLKHSEKMVTKKVKASKQER